MNRWNIPEDMENEIIKRDKKCVYCGIIFKVILGDYLNHLVNMLNRFKR